MKQISKWDLMSALEWSNIENTFEMEDQLQGHIETIRTLIANALDERFVTISREATKPMFLAFVDTINTDSESTGSGSFELAYSAMIAAYKPPADGSE